MRLTAPICVGLTTCFIASLVSSNTLQSYGQMGSNVAGPLYWRQYNNSQLGISMKYPSNWFIAAQNEGTLLVRFCSAGCFANYNVRVQPISELPLSNSDINTI